MNLEPDVIGRLRSCLTCDFRRHHGTWRLPQFLCFGSQPAGGSLFHACIYRSSSSLAEEIVAGLMSAQSHTHKGHSGWILTAGMKGSVATSERRRATSARTSRTHHVRTGCTQVVEEDTASSLSCNEKPRRRSSNVLRASQGSKYHTGRCGCQAASLNVKCYQLSHCPQ